MKTFIAATFAAAAMAVQNLDHEFMQFVSHHGKNYQTVEEFAMRFDNFVQTHNFIQEHNSSNSTHSAAHNKFSDWTREEYTNMLGLKNMDAPKINGKTVSATNASVPSSVNWVEAGKVNAVKDQGQCGSCWSFSTTASMESAHAIKTGELLSLSEQELVDCSWPQGNMGCNGGWYYYGWNYLESHVSELEASYPYTAKDGRCHYDESAGSVETLGSGDDQGDYVSVTGSPDAIREALVQQPCSVAIQADQRVFQTYSSGVLTSTSCGTDIDHAVTAVGYGTENGSDYVLVRNSWGSSWGESGYIKIGLVDGAGICGVNQYVAYPNVKN